MFQKVYNSLFCFSQYHMNSCSLVKFIYILQLSSSISIAFADQSIYHDTFYNLEKFKVKKPDHAHQFLKSRSVQQHHENLNLEKTNYNEYLKKLNIMDSQILSTKSRNIRSTAAEQMNAFEINTDATCMFIIFKFAGTDKGTYGHITLEAEKKSGWGCCSK